MDNYDKLLERISREKFKINYSVLAVIKSRTRQLNFIWRPTITAVQFKRQMERVFG